METLALASEYLQNGFSIFPLHPRTKKPLLSIWEPYQRTLPDYQQIEMWFSNGHAQNNIAIVAGKISRKY